jgi:outer membrane receptor protein involved in Fe transport
VNPINRPEYQFIERDADNPLFEIGFDIERNLSEALFGKFIFLFIREYWDEVEIQTITDSRNIQTLIQTADTFNVTTEGITRLEFDWSGIADHAIQFNLEGAYNLLDGKFSQTDDEGFGPAFVDVPGANSEVEEIRGDFVLQDTWSTGLLEFEYGLGGEVSRITQTGDVDQERSFFFIKPHSMVTYSPESGKQTRLRLAREISQLNLRDFISATVFEDNDLALGNPDIRPDTTWVAELSHERRMGGDSSVKLTVFHHWIKDVLDLLPLSSDFEAPGNIGDGRRWGVELESTLPLDWTGLSGARLRFQVRWQDSSVTDPVTGNKRVLSMVGRNARPLALDLENEYAYTIDFRQDFEVARVAWGWTLTDRAERPR